MPNPSTNRVTEADLAKFRTETNLERKGFTLGGAPIDPDHAQCFARQITEPENGHSLFFLLRATYGLEAGNFYNPNSPNFDKHARGPTWKNQKAYEWVKVRREAFDSYMQYLKTGNPAHVYVAQREQGV